MATATATTTAAATTRTVKRIDRPQKLPGRIRGVTRARYLTLIRMVRKGEATWDELERRGIVFPAGRESDYRKEVRRALNTSKKRP